MEGYVGWSEASCSSTGVKGCLVNAGARHLTGPCDVRCRKSKYMRQGHKNFEANVVPLLLARGLLSPIYCPFPPSALQWRKLPSFLTSAFTVAQWLGSQSQMIPESTLYQKECIFLLFLLSMCVLNAAA